jgi:uncharacterized protein (TIGR02284 family)
MSNNNAASILNDLITTLKDGQEGFRAAAEDVKSSELKTLFGEFSLQRSKFAGELQMLSRTVSGEEPEKNGSVAGAVHRGWIDLKAALVSRNDHAILAECERGEDSAVAAYRDALTSGKLPSQVMSAIQTQADAIQAAHDRVRDLRDATVA